MIERTDQDHGRGTLMTTTASEARAESAAAFLNGLMNVVNAFDAQLAWIDMHGAELPPGDGLVAWPGGSDTDSEIGSTEYWLDEGHGPGHFASTQTITLLSALKRVDYLIGRYRLVSHPGDRAYYVFAAGQTRDEIAESIRVLACELREWISG